MSASLQSWGRMGFAVLALALTSLHGQADDEVRRSFDRMLARDAAAAATTAVVSAEAPPADPADPLVAALVQPLRDGVWPEARPAMAAARLADPVVAGFARMLSHEPSTHTPPLPADVGTDPLIAAVVLPLLRERAVTVAGGAPIARH